MKILSKTFVFVNFTEPTVMDKELNQYFEKILEKYPGFSHKTDVITDQLVFGGSEGRDAWRTILIRII